MSLPTVFYLSDSSMSSLSLNNQGKKKRGGNKAKNQIPTGDVLIDSSKKEWVIHSSIARGGFGEIYTASGLKCAKQQDYVIKIEPSENGPLFCEKTVYIRIGKKEDIKDYMKSKGLKSLGMPQFYGCGIHNSVGKKFRFLVMERYGRDLWSIFLEQNRIFPPATVYKIANQVLDVLEYIHSKGYVHADIKGANLLLGRAKGLENQVYLVDFGLAARYTNVFKPDPRRAHNGTLEYTSRDGHEGIVTRRGDIEVLGYNILQWISSNLPWELTKDINEVQNKKIKFMKDCNLLLKSCFQHNPAPRPLEKYFCSLSNMGPLEEPKYDVLRQHMKEGLSKLGDTTSKLEFDSARVRPATREKSKTTVTPKTPSPVPNKMRKLVVNNRNGNNNLKKSPLGKKKKLDETIDVSADTDESDSGDIELDYEEKDMFIESSPEEKKIKRNRKQKETTVKRSWKDCPSVVSCAELLLKDDRVLRRSNRKK